MPRTIVILVTTSSKEEARKLADALLEERLIACANIVEGIRSLFRWQESVCNEEESLLILKTLACRLEEIQTRVEELHSYEVPEIIALPVIGGSEDYLDWVAQESDPATNGAKTA